MADTGLLLVRHGKAEDGAPLGDEARALTIDGRREFREHAKRLPAKIKLSGVITSPLVRAVQTAEILAEAMGLAEVRVANELSTDEDSDRLAAFAREVGTGWALVGHNPNIAEALALLVGRGEPPRFRKGAAVALAPGAGRTPWRVLWSAAPGDKFLTVLE
jgi:phosphohistidine phosphatase